MKLLCDAVAFGFGPISKLLAICSYLPSSWSVTLLATGTSATLAAESGFRNIVECDTEDMAALRDKRQLFLNADLFLNVMNPVSAAYAHELGLPMVTVDSLFWMWDAVPNYLLTASRYFIQNFPGVEKQMARFRPVNARIVGPIIDTRYRTAGRDRENQLLINVGGLRSKLVPPCNNFVYLRLVGQALTSALADHTFARVVITGDSQSLETSLAYWNIPRSKIVMLSHSEFLTTLANSRVVMTSPGLTASYEAFVYQTPTVFLPPQNLSQFLILDVFRAHGAAPRSIHWRDYCDADVHADLSEREGVQRVVTCIQEVDSSASLRDQLRRDIESLHSPTALVDAMVGQTAFLSSLGTNGAEGVVTELVNSFGR
jgi:hydroxymethylcytosylglucuronate/cytosylglucuronate synthase